MGRRFFECRSQERNGQWLPKFAAQIAEGSIHNSNWDASEIYGLNGDKPKTVRKAESGETARTRFIAAENVCCYSVVSMAKKKSLSIRPSQERLRYCWLISVPCRLPMPGQCAKRSTTWLLSLPALHGAEKLHDLREAQILRRLSRTSAKPA